MKVFQVIIMGLAIILMSSCKPKGCTDPRASNFSYEAEKEDGSCVYLGCTDPDALNYDPDAKTDDESCTYLGGLHIITTRPNIGTDYIFIAVKINQEYIGSLSQSCNDLFPTCETTCNYLSFTQQFSGFYTLQFWEIQQVGLSNFDTLFISESIPIKVIEKECNIVDLK